MFKEKIMEFTRKHKESLSVLGLLLVCYFLYFFKMGSYPLIDVDETRYVAMARDMFHSKDYMTLFLNGDFFFEKPPLYFWLETASFALFNHVNEWSARFPVAMTATFGVLITYWFAHRIVSRKFAIISALILATSFEYIMLSKIAILDMLLTVCIEASVICGFYSLFCRKELQKYFVWLAFVFAGFGIMAKGIPGFVLPAVSVFLGYLIARRLKELFRPSVIIPAVILLGMVSVPWNVLMLNMYDPLFFNEYIMKHHLSRFLGSKQLGREEPWYFLIGVFAVCFLPWITSFIAQICVVLKKCFKNIKNYFIDFNGCSRMHQFMILNTVHFLVVFIFFSAASTKLPTYILPAFFPASLMLGKFWYDYIFENKNEKALNISTIVLAVVFAVAAIAGAIVPFFLPEDIKPGILVMQPYVVTLFALCATMLIYSVIKNKKKLHFGTLVAFMAVLAMIASIFVFKFISFFGQDDLMEYAKFAKSKNLPIASFDFGRRYSVLYYYGKNVDFITDGNYESLNRYITEYPENYIIIKNKFLKEFDTKMNFEIIKEGEKYSLVKNTVFDNNKK